MLLKSAVRQTFDMRKFGCLLHNDTTVFICVDPSQPQFVVATLSNKNDVVALYDAIIKNWAYGEDVFDVQAWLSSNYRK